MASGLSPSGARIRGDDYQHLFAWVKVAEAVREGSGIAAIGIEDPKARNADDVTVYMDDGRREYYQVKSSVNGRRTVGMGRLVHPSRAGGPSMLRRFHELWSSEPGDRRPRITLVTNSLPSPEDPLFGMKDGRDGTIYRGLESASPGSGAADVRRKLACHLETTEEDVVEFFRDVRFKVGIDSEYWTDMAKHCMLAAGLLHDGDAIARGVGIVRGWVTAGMRNITAAKLRREVEPLKRPKGLPSASILVQAIDRDPVPDAYTVALDWVDSFPGNEPRVRCQPSDPALWNGRFRPELRRAATCLRSQGHARVLVRGHMRLPTWFAVGAELGRSAGFQVSSLQGDAVWSSEGSLSRVDLKHTVRPLGSGRDIAVGISLAYELSRDVLGYLREREIGAGRYVWIRPADGAGNQSVGGAAEARGWAYGVRDLIRKISQKYGSDQVHLFLAGPSGAVLLLGHLWDRMPSTQLYEYLGTAGGYAPSYLIPGMSDR